jgi:hypothetical protein
MVRRMRVFIANENFKVGRICCGSPELWGELFIELRLIGYSLVIWFYVKKKQNFFEIGKIFIYLVSVIYRKFYIFTKHSENQSVLQIK